MSFRINTNTTALNALRNLGNNSDLLSQSITKLSTGLRINSAADDPAGLIISEKYKAQIGGLDQAIKNSQDGVNYAKTADGALAEVSNLLLTARSLAVAAANTGTLSATAIQADQAQIASIAASISRIATNTQFGSKKLLDGSSGVVASITDATKLSALNIGGTFGGVSLTTPSGVGVQVTQAATQSTLTSKALAFATSTVGVAGSFSINGTTFTTLATDTAQQVVDKINQATGTTGIAASYDAVGGDVQLNSTAYGSSAKLNLTDANGVFLAAAGVGVPVAGVDALATVTVNAVTALFTGSRNGKDGLGLTDADGNSLSLTQPANLVAGNAIMGQINVGTAQFQIGANANQTTSMSLGNFAASQLGTGVAAGVNLSNMDLTTASGATQAIQIVDAAIDQVTGARGQIGAFQSDILESNIRSLGVAKENLSAANSTISDTDVAAEMTNFTKMQILQSTGMAVLAQANQLPQAVTKLLQ